MHLNAAGLDGHADVLSLLSALGSDDDGKKRDKLIAQQPRNNKHI